MTQFIEILLVNGRKIGINIDNILEFAPHPQEIGVCNIIVKIPSGGVYPVKMPYSDLRKLFIPPGSDLKLIN